MIEYKTQRGNFKFRYRTWDLVESENCRFCSSPASSCPSALSQQNNFSRKREIPCRLCHQVRSSQAPSVSGSSLQRVYAKRACVGCTRRVTSTRQAVALKSLTENFPFLDRMDRSVKQIPILQLEPRMSPNLTDHSPLLITHDRERQLQHLLES